MNRNQQDIMSDAYGEAVARSIHDEELAQARRRALVCVLCEAEGFGGEVCPCYSAAIAEDIRTTWSKVDVMPWDAEPPLDRAPRVPATRARP